MNWESFFTGLFTFLGLAVPAYFVYRAKVKTASNDHSVELYKLKATISQKQDEIQNLIIETNAHKKKSEYLPRIMQMKGYGKLKEACQKIFDRTRGDCVLFFVGVNAKYPIGFVSCIFSEYENDEEDFNAEDEYKNLEILKDVQYNDMLRYVEENPNSFYKVNTFNLPEGILKTAYYQEEVLFSRVGFLERKKIDDENDFIMFYSVRTHDDKDFTVREEKAIQMIVDSEIKPVINKLQELQTI